MKFETRNPKSEDRSSNSGLRVLRSAFRAFTLIELLTVIVIIGILAAILAPAVSHLLKGDNSLAATRQMLDDCARARQMAISQRTTVYMAFVPTNFWSDNAWGNLPVNIANSTTTTQLYGAQWNGYIMVSLRSIGDQPGKSYWKDLVRVKTLPDKAFIAPVKFTAPRYPSVAPFAIQTNFTVYGFLRTNTIPFPTSDVQTNTFFMNNYSIGNAHFVTLPYIAFNYLGQLTPGDGTVLAYDENIPLAYGTVQISRNQTNKAPTQGLPSVTEIPPGNSTNISYNIIHIDRLTGRARLERQEVR